MMRKKLIKFNILTKKKYKYKTKKKFIRIQKEARKTWATKTKKMFTKIQMWVQGTSKWSWPNSTRIWNKNSKGTKITTNLQTAMAPSKMSMVIGRERGQTYEWHASTRSFEMQSSAMVFLLFCRSLHAPQSLSIPFAGCSKACGLTFTAHFYNFGICSFDIAITL